jgi:hypothetical protein
MLKHFVLFLFIFVIGCKTISNQSTDRLERSENQAGVLLSCNGYKIWQDCYDLAANRCNGEYNIISKEENLVMQARTLRIECKK